MRKVFLDDLPRKKHGKTEHIDWKKSVGMTVKFVFDDITGEFIIVGINKNNNKIILSYNDSLYEKEGREIKNARIDAMIGKKVIDFRYKIGDNIKTDCLDIAILERYYKDKGSKGKVKCYKAKCNMCGWEEYHIEELAIKHRKQCSCCSGRTVVAGINDIPTTNPECVKFFQGGYDEAKLYSRGSGVKIKPICPDCGNVKDKAIGIHFICSHHSIGCSCGDKNSYPEKFVNEFLRQTGIEFTSEKKFNWSSNKRYDFYLKSIDMVIEVHGEQHYSRNGFKGRTLEREMENDAFKKKVAEENGLKYIEIDAAQSTIKYIKNSLINSELNEIFNMSNIDWGKCGERAASNLIKEASDLKRKNPNMKTTEIAKIIGRDYTTVSDYLKMGANLGWCEYDTKEEARRVAVENGAKSTSIPIQVYKNGEFLAEFKSGNDLTRRSEEVLGIKLYGKHAFPACRKNAKYKGYEFKCLKER